MCLISGLFLPFLSIKGGVRFHTDSNAVFLSRLTRARFEIKTDENRYKYACWCTLSAKYAATIRSKLSFRKRVSNHDLGNISGLELTRFCVFLFSLRRLIPTVHCWLYASHSAVLHCFPKEHERSDRQSSANSTSDMLDYLCNLPEKDDFLSLSQLPTYTRTPTLLNGVTKLIPCRSFFLEMAGKCTVKNMNGK